MSPLLFDGEASTRIDLIWSKRFEALHETRVVRLSGFLIRLPDLNLLTEA